MAKRKSQTAAEETYDGDLFDDAEEAQAMEQLWGEGQAEEGVNPIGTFQAVITEAEMGKSQSSNRTQIHYELVILAGAHKDLVLHKYDGLGDPDADRDKARKQVNITQGQLRRVGIPAKKMKLSALPAHLLKLKGKRVQIRTKQTVRKDTGEEFYNIYFNKLIGRTGAVAAGKTAKKAKKTARARKTRTF